MAKTLVLLNPHAGLGRAAKAWGPIQDALHKGGLVFDSVQSQSPRHAITLAEQAKRNGYETIIAVGGDGIVHEIVNGIMRSTNGDVNGTFGVVPVGSGNDYAKMVPLAGHDWQTAVQKSSSLVRPSL